MTNEIGRWNPAWGPEPTKNNRDDDDRDYLRCGRCCRRIPNGGAHVVVNYRYVGQHQLFCPKCCPCRRKPGTVRPFGANVF